MSRRRQVNRAVKTAKKYPIITAVIIVLVLIVITVFAVMYFLKIGPFRPLPDGA